MTSSIQFATCSSVLYSANPKKNKRGQSREGRKKLNANETICMETTFDALKDKNATPTKRARYARNWIEFSTSEIDDHVDKKIHLLVLRLCEVFNTNFFYSQGRTPSQGTSASPVSFRYENRVFREVLQAVHSSLLPALNAQQREDYERWLAGDGPEPKMFILNARSGLDNHQNSTKRLPDSVNRVDIMLEGGKTTNGLRTQALVIINKVAQKQLSVLQGAKDFLDIYEAAINEKIAQLSLKDSKVNKKYKDICEVFLKNVTDHKKFMNLSYVERVLDLPRASEDMKEEERQAICDARCGFIQKRAALESSLSKTAISPLRRQALGRRKRSPHNFNMAFEQCAFEGTSQSGKARKALLDQFNLSDDQIRATGDCQKASEFIRQKQLNFENLKKRAEEKFDALKENVKKYNLDVFNVFLENSGLSLDEVISVYQEIEDIDKQEILNIKEGLVPLSNRNMKIFSLIFERDCRYFEMDADNLSE